MSQSDLLKDKIALITGCNRGIGRAILERFAEEKAVVYASARIEGSIDDIALELSEKYNTVVIPVYFDVTDIVSLKQVFTKINKEQKRLDCLVNNAGKMQDALIGMVTENLMQELFSVNVFAVINMIQYAAKFMIRQKSGSIINISSIIGTNGNPGQIVYSASKGAVVSLTKTAAKELAHNNIRVNAIAPGIIDTDLLVNVNSDIISNRISKIAMGRIGLPEDVANVAVFLASNLSNYVTGQTIGVDGSVLI
ncbi:MAG: SDR family oxidoreductase [Bacteroidales bacterium]